MKATKPMLPMLPCNQAYFSNVVYVEAVSKLKKGLSLTLLMQEISFRVLVITV